MELKNTAFEENLAVWSVTCPYFGPLHQWYLLMSQLCRKSRKVVTQKTPILCRALGGCRQALQLVSKDRFMEVKHNEARAKGLEAYIGVGLEAFPYFLFKLNMKVCEVREKVMSIVLK
jgi:hypothetical protein